VPRRRLILEDPPSRLAIWSRRLALFALAVALLSLLLLRGNFVETVPGFAVFASSLVLAVLALVAALAAFVVIWIYGLLGFGRALFAFVAASALLAYPAVIGFRSYGLPAIADISTDTADPPRFEAIARLRPRAANPVAYPGPEIAQKQRAAYPDIVPLQTAAPPDEVYTAALDVLSGRNWAVVEARTPQAGRRDGRIEAVARTLIMGFRDDVVVRVRPIGTGTRIDIRSASRYGRNDFGSNASRVRSLMAEIEESVGSQPATR
jgi:uncharacterized protein (DUF1499 family)